MIKMCNYGYAGRILFVNLTTRELWVEELQEKYISGSLGGFGLVGSLLYDNLPKNCDPLSLQNVIVMGAGALGGTPAPGASQIYVGTKMVNYRTGEWSVGGNMGFMLKHSGFDAVIIQGKADAPVYLKISQSAEICDAAEDLWGLDTVITTERLWGRHIGSSVISIGVAGENLVKDSVGLVDNIAPLGRGGLGAIMGSKNLKAIVACGGSKIKLFHPERFRHTAQKILKTITSDPLYGRWVKDGMMVAGERFEISGFTKSNLAEFVTDEDAAELWDRKAWEESKVRNIACMSCPVADQHLLELKSGPFKGTRVYVSSFIDIARSIGIELGFSQFDKIVKAYDDCIRYGIDHYTFPALFRFAVQLYEKGIITKNHTDGLELKVDFNTALEMMKRIAYRQNIGDMMAAGGLEGAHRAGQDTEAYSHRIKGIYQIHGEGKWFRPELLDFVTSPWGSNKAAEKNHSPEVGRSRSEFSRYAEMVGIPDNVRKKILVKGSVNVGSFFKWVDEYYSLLGSLGICSRPQVAQGYNLKALCDLYFYATGRYLTEEELHRKGSRVWNTYKMLNVRDGVCSRESYPGIWFHPFEERREKRGVKVYFKENALSREEVYKLLDDYYEENGWDKENGIPTPERLRELGLEDMIKDLPLDTKDSFEGRIYND